MKADDNLRLLDYSSAYSGYRPWKVSNLEICNNDENGKIIEFPIFSDSRSLFEKIINKINKMNGGRSSKDLISCFMAGYGTGMPLAHRRQITDRLKDILSKDWSYIDFCLNEPSYLVNRLKKVISDCKRENNYNYVPVVLIGHSKDFFFANNLSRFLSACQNIEEVEFNTYFEAVKKKLTS